MSSHYIHGEWIEGNAMAFSSTNPATGETVWNGKAADSIQVESAVEAAKKAFQAWANTSLDERLHIITTFRDRIEKKKTELATLIAHETGKIMWDAAGEAAATIGKLNFALKAYKERSTERSNDMGGFHASLRHRPHGVMAVYGPYNFPAHLPNGHIIPALLAGNTIVFKPSELTPAVGAWMVEQWHAAGLPAGVINLVQGEKETGIALANADIDGLLFTGSSATGALLHKQFAGRPEVLLALELGGNNPLVVHDISDIKAAVYETIQSAYISTGQRCTCARRLIVTQGDWTDDYLQLLADTTKTLALGKYDDDPAPFMGPLVSSVEAEKLLAAHDGLLENGGISLAAMTRQHDSLPFISAGLIDVTNIKNRADEEWFGPLLQVIRVSDMDAAIAEANRTKFGLSAGLLSDDPATYHRFVHSVRAGIINWNKQTTGASGMAPFGGIGASGNHHPAGYYAADYCAYPVASMEAETLKLPEALSPGVNL